MIELPLTPTAPTEINPRVLVMYSYPKVGKTPCVAQLPKSLILDLEGGTDMVTSTKMSIIGLNHKRVTETPEEVETRHTNKKYYLSEVIIALRKGNPYKFIIVDTITKLEDWCDLDATVDYMESSIGKSFNRYSDDDFMKNNSLIPGTLKPKSQWASVLTLPKGSGYYWLRKSFEKWILRLLELTPTPLLILNGHVKLVTVGNKDGKEVEGKDLDLTGKIKTDVTAFKADATGYLYREGNKNFLSFVVSDEVKAGCRIPRLEGKILLLSEKLEDGTIKTYWENIYEGLVK